MHPFLARRGADWLGAQVLREARGIEAQEEGVSPGLFGFLDTSFSPVPTLTFLHSPQPPVLLFRPLSLSSPVPSLAFLPSLTLYPVLLSIPRR
jgi:hypothetical protein